MNLLMISLPNPSLERERSGEESEEAVREKRERQEREREGGGELYSRGMRTRQEREKQLGRLYSLHAQLHKRLLHLYLLTRPTHACIPMYVA